MNNLENDNREPGVPSAFGSSVGINMETSRRRFLSITGLALGGAIIGVGASACGTAQTGSNTGGAAARAVPGASGDTLFVAGFQWGPPANFNPLNPQPRWPAAGGQSQFIFESLLRFNLLDGSLAPGLAKELQADGQVDHDPALAGGTKCQRRIRPHRRQTWSTPTNWPRRTASTTRTSGTTWTRSPLPTPARCSSSSSPSPTTPASSRNHLPLRASCPRRCSARRPGQVHDRHEPAAGRHRVRSRSTRPTRPRSP